MRSYTHSLICHFTDVVLHPYISFVYLCCVFLGFHDHFSLNKCKRVSFECVKRLLCMAKISHRNKKM